MIGGSGVGKSTWINAFANYCSFESLHEAQKAGGIFPVPYTCNAPDPKTGKMISISSEFSSKTSISTADRVGEADTQNSNEYVFEYKNTEINVIDTPGLLYTTDKGTATDNTDKEHINNILRLLSAYNNIHAICIFLSATETRLSEAFQYTLTEILGRLDKSATNNVIFVFTYASNFKEYALPILERFLALKELTIPLPPHKDTVYYFQNDVVEYLVECKNKIPHDEDDIQLMTRNWKKSRNSTISMIRYACSLKPLLLTGINTMYDAECTISIMSKLVLETLQCVAKDVNDLNRRKEEAENMKAKISSSATKFEPRSLDTILVNVPRRKVVHIEIDRINVVCEGRTCANIVDGELVYKQICCENCDSRILYFCKNMSWLGVCKRCGCPKSKHQWKRTSSKVVTVTEQLKQEKVHQAPVTGRDGAIAQINAAISKYHERVNMYEDEKDQMLRTCAKLNTYVNQNALVTSSNFDELTRSLDNRIETYRGATSKQLNDLKLIRTKYDKCLLEEKSNRYTPSDVHELMQQLYKLPVYGNDLKEAMEVEERARRKVAVEKKTANPVKIMSGFF